MVSVSDSPDTVMYSQNLDTHRLFSIYRCGLHHIHDSPVSPEVVGLPLTFARKYNILRAVFYTNPASPADAIPNRIFLHIS